MDCRYCSSKIVRLFSEYRIQFGESSLGGRLFRHPLNPYMCANTDAQRTIENSSVATNCQCRNVHIFGIIIEMGLVRIPKIRCRQTALNYCANFFNNQEHLGQDRLSIHPFDTYVHHLFFAECSSSIGLSEIDYTS